MEHVTTQVIRVLLVDRDPGSVRRIEDLVDGAGEHGAFLFEHAPSVEAALTHERHQGAGVVLLAPSRPGAAGLDVLALLGEQFPDEPVLVLSQDGDEDLGRIALQLGAQDSLRRADLTPATLARAVRFALERAHLRHELTCLATIDPLTGLPNRRGLQQRLAIEVARRQRTGSELLALMLDLDDFKRINDLHGHACGDAVLRSVARRLNGALRATDAAARIGGDEFIVLLPGTRLPESRLVAERIRLALAAPLAAAGGERITASMGVVAVSGANPVVDDLLVQTHHLLRRSKLAGKNCVSLGEAGLDVARDETDLLGITRQLCAGRALHAVHQPIHQLRSGRVVGREFLCRSSIPVFEHPTDFFRASLETHSLTAVDRICWRTCVQASRGFPAAQRRHINLFASTLAETPVEELLAELPEAGRQGYCVELGAWQAGGDPGRVAESVAQLRDAGLSIALDDLGCGRSSVESLLLLEPEFVKLDRRCTTGIAVDAGKARALDRLLAVAHTLGSVVIAEGIESDEDLAALREHGVPLGQGFLWGRPAEDTSTVHAA